jgi:hypothetical protein
MNKTALLFSLTVHENESAINDFIEFARYAYQSSYFILHVNSLWGEFDSNKLLYLNDRVFINSNRFEISSKFCGKTGLHVSNIEYFNNLDISYDFIIISASNELYLKKINVDYLEKYKYGSNCNQNYWSWDSNTYIHDVQLISLMKSLFGEFCHNGFHEGIWFSKKTGESIVSFYRNKISREYDVFNCDEELLLPSILYFVENYEKRGSGLNYFHQSQAPNFEEICDFINNKNDLLHENYVSIKRIDRNNKNLRNQLKKMLL